MRENEADYKFIQMEINKLKCICDEMKTQADGKNSWNWTDLMTAPGQRALTIGIVLILINQCCGCFAMINYTADILKIAGSDMTANVSAIVIGGIQLLGACFSLFLVDCTGRKVISVFIQKL